ncbi:MULTISPECIES: SpaH/EbpB family LPXTG-anchored major pilin [Streptococcus]|uniref:SpaH/EbpB family LPXTG-anchored major pilin n=1 Tax=Streptococcus TaxID=1301 RepID=UPI000CF5B648|nr:SpaH/EbpB family LPXTG-anchored major pilin [Streptococcus suis]NQL78439.1 SpaH/EbpB family LPXTG-anchored major pilin [Streptococcus suis]HEM4280562.1 SpaH/EbpB family LPXTG-anchored major pilin [Streptococcus suis]HEM5029789.1 SpaH/EbpB family LPXTG-anchored major pilin [Streptococcus suis]HEM5105256.1 SpaH/EbpB family LPXTG-anchored major pilin [Streptococcus suis]HEM5157264.1 SpaH/EbpB family LPXTG-anchored major pilin [Streptococcus suis]
MKKLQQFFTSLVAVLTVFAFGSTALAQTVDSGKSGAGTITVSNASQGQTYTAYKLFDATVTTDGSGISYKLPAGKTATNFGGDTWFEVDSKGNVTAKAGADLTSAEFKGWAVANGEKIVSAQAEDNTLVFTNVPYGYYYIESSLGSIITVDSTKPNVTVIDKNTTKPTIPDPNDGGGKKILSNGATTSETTAKIGDTVNFQIKFNATNYLTKDRQTTQIVSYTITDTPTALAINQNSVNVKVDGVDITAKISKTFDATGKMNLVLTWADAAANNKTIYNSPVEVIITYSAVVTKDAKEGEATNSATIGYNTIDNPATPPTPVDPDKPTETTKVTTHRFTLKKTNEAKATLTGAEFKLYDAVNNGTEIKVVKESDGVYRVAQADEQGVAIEAGEVVIKGLKHSTTYYLEEVKAPNGYNILTERQAIEVTKDNTAQANIVNKKGGVLPSTGAIGTTLFYLVGSILLLVALVYTISKRRMNNI